MSGQYIDYLEHVVEEDRILKIRISLRNTLLPQETREELALRRKLMNEELKEYKKGRVFYDPYPYGRYKELGKGMYFKVPGVPYVKEENGEH
jgi:hypothetical protein